MDDLVAFLRARLAEDEAVALAAADYDDGAEHDVSGPPGTWVLIPDEKCFGPAYPGGMLGPRIGHTNHVVLGRHVIRHDPARVLPEIEAKREVLRLAERARDYHETFTSGFAAALEHVLRLFAQADAGHPDYQPGWALMAPGTTETGEARS